MTDFILIDQTYINKNNICFIESTDLLTKKKPSKYVLTIGFTGSVKNIVYSSSEERNKVLNKLISKTVPSVIVETPVEPITNNNSNRQGITRSISSPYNPYCQINNNNNNNHQHNPVIPPPPYSNDSYLNYSSNYPAFTKVLETN